MEHNLFNNHGQGQENEFMNNFEDSAMFEKARQLIYQIYFESENSIDTKDLPTK